MLVLALTLAPDDARADAPATPMHPAALSPLLDAEFLGVTPSGAVMARARTASGTEVRAWFPPAGPIVRLPAEAPSKETLTQAEAASAARLWLVVDPALGDRPAAAIWAGERIDPHGCAGLSASSEAEVLRLPPVRRPRLRGPFALGRYGIVEIELGGRRSIEALDLPRIEADLLNRAALDAYGRGCLDAAEALWQTALEREGSFGDAAYNLACAKAQRGALEEARSWYELARRLDPARYSRLYQQDPDLEPLRRQDHPP
ncbi:MAG: tetratricopeptide repeat protein [Myxococcota bacterium]